MISLLLLSTICLISHVYGTNDNCNFYAYGTVGVPLNACYSGQRTSSKVESSMGYYCYGNKTSGFDVIAVSFTGTTECDEDADGVVMSKSIWTTVLDCGGIRADTDDTTCRCDGDETEDQACTTFTETTYDCDTKDDDDAPMSYTTIVLDLCVASGSSSYNYQCDSTTTIASNIYSSTDCTGDKWSCGDNCGSVYYCDYDYACDPDDDDTYSSWCYGEYVEGRCRAGANSIKLFVVAVIAVFSIIF